MKKRFKELQRLRVVCLEQAQAASTELEKHAFLEIAEQYKQALEAGAIVGIAKQSRQAANAVGWMKKHLRGQSQWFLKEFPTRADGILPSIKSLLWLTLAVATALFVALYVPW